MVWVHVQLRLGDIRQLRDGMLVQIMVKGA